MAINLYAFKISAKSTHPPFLCFLKIQIRRVIANVFMFVCGAQLPVLFNVRTSNNV